mgnify:CR=1 FL=1
MPRAQSEFSVMQELGNAIGQTNEGELDVNVVNALSTEDLNSAIADLEAIRAALVDGGGVSISVANMDVDLDDLEKIFNGGSSVGVGGPTFDIGQLMTDIKASIQLLDDAVGTTNGTSPTKGKLVGGKDSGGDFQPLKIATDGTLQVDIGSTITETNSAAIKTAIDTITAAVNSSKMDVNLSTSGITLPVSGSFFPATQPVSGTVGVSGTVTVDGSASTQPVSGTVTETNSAAIKTSVEALDNAIAGNEMQVDVVTMPNVTVNGTVTANVGTGTQGVSGTVAVSAVSGTVTTTEGSGTTIATNTAKIDDVQAADAGTNPAKGVMMGGTDGSNLQYLLTDGQGHLQVDVLSGASGGTVDTELTIADLDTGVGTDTKAVVGVALAESGGGQLLGSANPMPVSGTFWQTTQPISGSVTEANSAAIKTAVEALDNAIGGNEMQVDVVAALPAGTNNIGDVDIASALPAGGNNIGDVDIASASFEASDGATAPTKGVMIGGKDGADFQVLKVNSDGELVVNLEASSLNIGDVDIASELPAGSNNIGNVDIASALPAGANAIGKLAANDGVDIGNVDVTSLPSIPTGANAIGKLAANSGVDIGDVDVLTLPPIPAGTNNIGDVDVASASFEHAEDEAHTTADKGVHILAVRKDTAAAQTNADGDYSSLLTDSDGKLHVNAGPMAAQIAGDVNIGDVSLAPSLADGGSLTGVEGLAVGGKDGSGNFQMLKVNADGELEINLEASTLNIGDVDIASELPAGTNNIGDVDIASALPAGANAIGKLAANSGVDIGDVDVLTLPALPAGTNNIGDVDIASAIPAGNNNIGNVDVVTLPSLAAGTNAIGKLAANSGIDIGDVDVTSLPSLAAGTNNIGDVDIASAGFEAVDGATVPSKGVMIGGKDGSDFQAVKVNSDGELLVNLEASSINIGDVDIASALPAGNNNIGNVDIASSLPAGANAIGKLAANSGVDIGDVDVTSLPSLPAGANAIGKLAANSGVDIGDVDVTSLPSLPAGNNNIGNVDIVTLPSLAAGTNAIGKLAANSGVDIGDVDVTSLPVLPAGNNNIGNVDIASSLPAGTNAIGKLSANSGVDIGDVDVTSLPSLPAGNNNIGNVDIASALPAGTNAIGKLAANTGVDIGDVDVTSLPSIPAGTNNIGDVDIASASFEAADGATAPSKGVMIGGLAGTDFQALKVNADGELVVNLEASTLNIGDVDIASELPAGTQNIGNVDIASAIPAGNNNIGNVDIASALPAGNNNIGNVDIASSLPAGTNAIGKLSANNGVDIGDVDVTSLPALPTGSNAIGSVTVTSAPTTAVTGSFYQGTQPVSIASMPTTAVTTVQSAFDTGQNAAVGTTRVQVKSASQALQSGITVVASSANTASIFLGDNGVTSSGGTIGFELAAGAGFTFSLSNANLLYAISASGTQTVNFVSM